MIAKLEHANGNQSLAQLAELVEQLAKNQNAIANDIARMNGRPNPPVNLAEG